VDYKLILMDIDGTISDRDSIEIYPRMRRFIEALGPDSQVAFITNQGGPPCRNAGWGFSDQFPSKEKILSRLDRLMEAIYNISKRKPSLYVAWIYEARNGSVYNLSGLIEDKIEIKKALYWRKPGPGMILQALLDSCTMPADALVIGDDLDKDAGAAEAAGVAFRHASELK
jgi:phosphoglycolate phosphatase-like HAD superfamily hydrolase